MMKIRPSILLLWIFLLVAFIFLIIFYTAHQTDKSSLRFSFEVNEVEKIQIGRGSSVNNPTAHLLLTLVKATRMHEQDWKIPDLGNASADRTKINRLLEQIHHIQGQLVVNDESAFSDFGITNEAAFRVSLFSQNWKPILTLLIGNKRNGLHSFIREMGSLSVYQVDGDLLSFIGIKDEADNQRPIIDFWLEK